MGQLTSDTMDTRKLRTAEAFGDPELGMIRIQDANTFEQLAGCYTGGLKGREHDEATAAELVRRWNAYPEQQERIAKLEAKLREVEALLHDGPTAEEDGEVVRAVREREGDYLSMLTDIGAGIEAFLAQ